MLFGVAAIIAMLSIGEGAKLETLEQIAKLGTNCLIIRQQRRNEEQKAAAFEKQSKGLNQKDLEALTQNISALRCSAPIKTIEASLGESMPGMSPEIIAVNRSYAEIKGLRMLEGRFITELDLERKHLICVLGYEVAKNLGNSGHAKGVIFIGNIPFEIAGVLKSTEWKEGKTGSIAERNIDKTIFIPLGAESSLPRIPSYDGEELSEIILQIKNPKEMAPASKLVKSILNRMHGGYDDFQIIIPSELFEQASRSQNTFNLVLGSLAALSLLVGGIGIMNIMLATVYERTKEIGIRRSIGANKQHILNQFLVETLLITLIGALTGLLLGISLSYAISAIAGWKTIVSPWSVIIAFAMSCIVGLCSGLYPAMQAASMDPIKALRHE